MAFNSDSVYTNELAAQQNESDENGMVRNSSNMYISTYTDNATITLVERYSVPIICALGIVGNALSSMVFLQKSMRKKSCSLFLAVRGISDNGFLLTLLTIWLSSAFDLKLSKILGICQSLIFSTYVFGCVSVWLVVLVTVENYIRICKPFIVNHMCKPTNVKAMVVTLLFCALVCYNFPFWTMSANCEPHAHYHDFIAAMVYADSVLTLVIPTMIMTVLMIAMATKTIASCKRRRRLSTSSMKYTNPMTKVTTMLLAVTLIFILFNFPSHVVRLRLLIIALFQGSTTMTTYMDVSLQSVSQLFYFLSLAINFVVYYSFGSKFRIVFKDMFLGRRQQRGVLFDNEIRKTSFPLQSANEQNSFMKHRTGGAYNNTALQIDEYIPLRKFSSVKL